MRVLLLVPWLIGPALALNPNLPTQEFSLKMPFSKPVLPETYLCSPMKLDSTQTNYIVGFRPDAWEKTAHHILIYGCKSPALQEPIYNCGGMTAHTPGYKSSFHPCGEGNEIVYAWAKNAPELNLPEGVGFRVGKGSKIHWLVLQVHYASVDYIPPEGDVSGVYLRYTNVEQPKNAGVFYLGTNGRLPAKTTTFMDSACALYENKVIHPFAFRVHTHGLGRVVSGWKVVGKNQWTLLGKEDPQLPQMFYPVSNNSTLITKGDTIAARCTMVNYRDEAVWVGSTKLNEMCNFYLMYWVDGKDILEGNSCTSVGPPIYSWDGWLLGGGLSNVPKEASSLP
ncbi:peptidylglycine alpha-hydroxylating monooxygenase-like [Tigriopus californicus]|nr:peptidylglycine alpha-hydroxylating monooxygenase-like [Tigriopus californicus]